MADNREVIRTAQAILRLDESESSESDIDSDAPNKQPQYKRSEKKWVVTDHSSGAKPILKLLSFNKHLTLNFFL
jgi:hypothetical protein